MGIGISLTHTAAPASSLAQRRFTWFSTAVLIFNLPVILWGAYVRASFSGDGCGAHWPFCNGQVIPQNMQTPTAIEFTHRMMTSLDTFAVIAMCIWAFRAFPKRHAVRLYSVLSLVFLFIEALLGAGLVVFRLVAKDQSAGRAVYLSAHLTNTMLLLGALTLTAWLSSRDIRRFAWRGVQPKMLWAMAVTVSVSITGAITALGDTLFPASSIATGVGQDFAVTSTALLRLRVIHPIIAVCGAAYVIWISVESLKRDHGRIHSAASWVLSLILFQLAVGALNISLLAPIWMQLFHLFVADVVWIGVVLLAAETGQEISEVRT